MKTAIIIAICALALSGCVSRPMTPADQAAVAQIIQMNQHNFDEMNRNAAMIAAGAQPHAPTNCITSYASGTAYTTCQ